MSSQVASRGQNASASRSAHVGRPFSNRSDRAACVDIIRHGSKSFYAASRLLPSTVRFDAMSLYAFCRVSDDLVDDPRATLEAARKLKTRIAAAYAGAPNDHPADRLFADVVHKHAIPEAVPLSMVEGFEWDLTGRGYETIGEVIDYSARVAGTVGVMMSLLMSRRSERTLARACDLGVAMQLTNIARDVGEDARNGRCYLPEVWLRDHGLSSHALIEHPAHSPALGHVVEQLLETADVINERALTGIGDLPSSCQTGVRAAALVYAAIGKQVRRNGYNSIDQRAYTSRLQKLRLLAGAYLGRLEQHTCDDAPALDEVSYLVEAAVDHQEDPRSKAEWMLDLVGRLKQQERLISSRAS
ncbi:MAG: phytoene/squalene synthase family protein [Pseudomonadota bacterium]